MSPHAPETTPTAESAPLSADAIPEPASGATDGSENDDWPARDALPGAVSSAGGPC